MYWVPTLKNLTLWLEISKTLYLGERGREGEERKGERMREMNDSPFFEVGHNNIIGT